MNYKNSLFFSIIGCVLYLLQYFLYFYLNPVPPIGIMVTILYGCLGICAWSLKYARVEFNNGQKKIRPIISTVLVVGVFALQVFVFGGTELVYWMS